MKDSARSNVQPDAYYELAAFFGAFELGED